MTLFVDPRRISLPLTEDERGRCRDALGAFKDHLIQEWSDARTAGAEEEAHELQEDFEDVAALREHLRTEREVPGSECQLLGMALDYAEFSGQEGRAGSELRMLVRAADFGYEVEERDGKQVSSVEIVPEPRQTAVAIMATNGEPGTRVGIVGVQLSSYRIVARTE